MSEDAARRAAAELVAFDPRIAESLLGDLLLVLECDGARDLRACLEDVDVEALAGELEELRHGGDESAHVERQRQLALALLDLVEGR